MIKIEKEIFKLLQTYIRKNKIKGDNYSDNYKIPSCTMSSYVELHSDKDFGITENNPYFYIKPLFWKDGVSLIHQYGNKWYKTKFNGDIIKFNALRDHGLVHDSVADRLVLENRIFKNKWLQEAPHTVGSVKLIWIWLDKKEANDPQLVENRLNKIVVTLRNLNEFGFNKVYNENL